jgi:large subunit ribosomal protein L18
MDTTQLKRNRIRKTRILRVRKHLRGDQQKPRLCVIKSGRHLYVQIIDDATGMTLASTSTISKDFRNSEFNRKNKESGKQLGLKIAEKAKDKQITTVVFDRGRSKYHGVIAALADGAREGGLQL